MRAPLPPLILLALATPALAQPAQPHAQPAQPHAQPAQPHAQPAQPHAQPAQPHAQPAQPHAIGKFGQWQAATHAEGGGTTCFAFTRPEASPLHIPGRGDVVLSVTRRPRSHDVVAISAGFVLSGHEDAPLQAGGTRMLFYIAGRSAFAHDNTAAIVTFAHEASVTARLPGPRGITATDHFSLKGFSDALAAMARACPP